jgi:hypothetical protein
MSARLRLHSSFHLLVIGTIAVAACKPAVPGDGVGEPSAGTTGAPASNSPGSAGMTDTTGAAVTVRTSEARYAPGAEVRIAIVNHTGARYSFNPCPRTLERSQGGSWEKVEEPGRMCTMEAWLLDPHQTREATTELPSSLEAGTYRMVIDLIEEGSGPPAERVKGYSNQFEVG